ncbi:MAG: histone-like nucleoid-structuring protein, MvaT/MvaU family [Halomonas sp.]|nr:histone-like nucleoid-structuring protein, MvaT/MvaU family [Halomonas sp.]
MSTTLQQYVEKERLLKKISEELKQLEEDQGFQRELEFKNKLEELMSEFNKGANDVIDLLQPGKQTETKVSQPASGGRRKRRLKIYKNPNTGEVVETRGGNQKTLKAWKEEHGDETVESWLVRIED